MYLLVISVLHLLNSFFCIQPASPVIYTLSLHDALPIFCSTRAAVEVPSLGYSTVEPWTAASIARSSSPIWEGPSAPISTPAWEPTSRRSARETGAIRMKSAARVRKAAKDEAKARDRKSGV